MNTVTIQKDKVILALAFTKNNAKPILIGVAVGFLVYVALTK